MHIQSKAKAKRPRGRPPKPQVVKPLPVDKGGRPPKLDKDKWTQVTCVLRCDTVKQLKAGAGSTRFGNFLQEHLDRWPLPTRQEYREMKAWEGSIKKTALKAVKYAKDVAGKAA